MRQKIDILFKITCVYFSLTVPKMVLTGVAWQYDFQEFKMTLISQKYYSCYNGYIIYEN